MLQENPRGTGALNEVETSFSELICVRLECPISDTKTSGFRTKTSFGFKETKPLLYKKYNK